MSSSHAPECPNASSEPHLGDWQESLRNSPTDGVPTLCTPLRKRLTPAGLEAILLLERYRALSLHEVNRLRALSPMLSMKDVETIARSETLSHAMFRFYQDHGRNLRMSRSQFLRLMTVSLALAGLVLLAAHMG